MGRDWHLLSTQDWKVYKRFILRPWKIPPWTENQQGILRTLEIPIVQAAGPAASSQADVCTARSDLQGEHQNAVTGYCSTSTHGMLPVTAAHAHMGCSWFPQHMSMSTQDAAEMVKRGRDTALWRMPSVCVWSPWFNLGTEEKEVRSCCDIQVFLFVLSVVLGTEVQTQIA